MVTAGRMSGMVIQALRYLGQGNVDDNIIRILKKRLSGDDKCQLMDDIRYAPVWIGNIFRQLQDKKTTEKTTIISAEKVFRVINKNIFIKTHEAADKTELSQRTVENSITKLKRAGFLKRIGSPKSGHWKILSTDKNK